LTSGAKNSALRAAEPVEACTRAFLEGFLGGEDASYLDFATKQLAFFDDLGNAAAGNAEQVIRQRLHGIERVRVRRVGESVAEVDVNAWVRYVSDQPGGDPAEFTSRVTGPVILHRVDDGWRVADFIMDGLPFVRGGFTAAGETLELGGLSLIPVAMKRRDDSTLVFLDVRNRGTAVVFLEVISVRQRLLWFMPGRMYTAYLPSSTFEPGSHTVFAAAFDPRLPIQRRMQLEVDAQTQSGTASGVLEFELEQARLDNAGRSEPI
jgi:hypothetical protein